jgi:carotenoid isomerooxygenase
VSAIFKQPGENSSDNAMISIYPFGDEFFAFTESPVIHRINPETLDTEERVNLSDYLGIINHTSHPHVMADGLVYNLGQSITKTGPVYTILCFPHGENMFKDAHVVASVPARWRLHPSYMHTFGITERYFVIVEQPLTVSVPAVLKSQLTNQPMATCLKWFENRPTMIYLLNRSDGELAYTFQAEAFFYLHIINQYERDDHVVLDICCYKDPAMLNCMYVEHMKNMQKNPDYAKMFRGRPLRFVLPLKRPDGSVKTSLHNFFNTLKKSSSLDFDDEDLKKRPLKKSKSTSKLLHFKDLELSRNLVTLTDTRAEAYQLPNGGIFCKPELLCNLGCETPRVYYEEHLGREYQYFYAISSDVDATNPGTLIKVDVVNKTRKTWCEDNCYPSEPIFVASPEPQVIQRRWDSFVSSVEPFFFTPTVRG